MKIIERTLEIITIMILVALVGVVFLQIGSRLINNPLMWTEELSRHLLVYSTFLGGALAFYKGQGLRITALIERFHPSIRKFNDITIEVLCLVTSIVVLYFGLKLALTMWVDPTPAMRISKGLIIISVPLGFSLISIKIIKNILSHFRKSDAIIKEG